MPNGDILSQLAPQEAPLGAAAPPLDPQPGPPSPDGGGGVMDFLGGLGGGLQQASPMLLASIVGQTMGAEAMGAFMAGITSGQIERQKLQLQQATQERQLGIQEARVGLEAGRLEESRQAREAKAQQEARERAEKIVGDAIEERLGMAQQLIESGHPGAANDIRKGMKGFLQSMVNQHPEAANLYSPNEIELRFPKSLVETAYEEQVKGAVEGHLKNNQKFYQQLATTQGPAAVEEFLAGLPPIDIGDGDPMPFLEAAKKYGAPFGVTSTAGGDLTLTLPQPEPEVVKETGDAPGPPGTRQSFFTTKPTAAEVAAGGGRVPIPGSVKTPRPQQSMFGSLFPPTVRRETEAGAEELITIDRETGQPKGPAIQTKQPETPATPELSDYIKYRMAHPEYKGKFQQFVQDVESRRLRVK